MTDEDRQAIMGLIEARATAVRAGDVEAIMATASDDVVSFDVVEPLRRLGKAALRARVAEWLAMYEGAVGWENRDVHVIASGDVAFSHGLSRVTGTLKAGARVDMWFRTTMGFRRVDGRWRVTHDHASVPFNPENGQASLGLTPDPMTAPPSLDDMPVAPLTEPEDTMGG